MSITPPTIAGVNATIVAQIQAQLNQTIPLFPKSFIRILAKAFAAVFILLYKYAGFTFLQMFVRTATISNTEINGQTLSPLKEWGRLIGVGDPVQGTQAELTIDVAVTNQTGSIASGAQLVNNDTGVTYITITSVLLNAATVSINIRAVNDQEGGQGFGSIGNLEAGTEIDFANPLANIKRTAVVTATVVTGADGETTEEYRQRVIDRFQKRPQGGAYADYELWGEETAGIVNVYPYTGSAPGTVELYCEATPESSGSADGIPTSAQLDAVLNSVNFDEAGLATRRPANAFVLTYPIGRQTFDVTVTTLTVDDPATVQAKITAALTEYFLSIEPFITGLSVLPRRDTVSELDAGGIVSEIVGAAGGTVASVDLSVGGVPTSLYSVGIGEKAKIGTVSFV